ncbi:NAD-dependent dihydropyrimidine dehydrogenase subunit PreT [hydrothermal vent metagenome]|uniref:NAD-dependent dihydropyrimidine dehydrogenase subunit PreT n=1 Tax=hydrothermal vent metagenome TaxID=652676 RepID=A0A3B0RAP5_9ZZZZ
MADVSTSGVVAGRLDADQYVENFRDLHPPLSKNKAHVEADRCYFCHDAPCMDACPTSIDIALFIRQISTGQPDGAAETIFTSNILGGMCARVCPTETLCEEVCVHVAQGNLPVKIGQLQRYATDHAMQSGAVTFERAEESGKQVAVIGAGPAGLACAHRLAANGHSVTIFETREKPGGLNEFGLAAYKTTDNFAQSEVEFVLSIGGIEIEHGKKLGRDIRLEQLSADFDAVFVGLGLDATNSLGIAGDDLDGVQDAVDYIAELRQADDLAALLVGQQVVVIGGGMTAIDIAVQIKRLGARDVAMVYRRGPEQMGASDFECELALNNGVTITHWAMPTAITSDNGKVTAVEFERTHLADGKLSGTGETFTLPADQVFAAIGQVLDPSPFTDSDLKMAGRRIEVDNNRKTSLTNVWAGGDCIIGGENLTVSAVDDGNVAADAINDFLAGKGE